MPLMISLTSQLSLVIPGGHHAAVPASFGAKLVCLYGHTTPVDVLMQFSAGWMRLDPGLMRSLAFFISAFRISVCLLRKVVVVEIGNRQRRFRQDVKK